MNLSRFMKKSSRLLIVISMAILVLTACGPKTGKFCGNTYYTYSTDLYGTCVETVISDDRCVGSCKQQHASGLMITHEDIEYHMVFTVDDNPVVLGSSTTIRVSGWSLDANGYIPTKAVCQIKRLANETWYVDSAQDDLILQLEQNTTRLADCRIGKIKITAELTINVVPFPVTPTPIP